MIIVILDKRTFYQILLVFVVICLLFLVSCGSPVGEDPGNSDSDYIWITSPERYASTYTTDRPTTDMAGGSYVSSSIQCLSPFGGTISNYSVTWHNSANNASGRAIVGVHCLSIVIVYWDIYNIPLELGENIITVRVVDSGDGIEGTHTLTVNRLPDTTAPEVSFTSPWDGATDQSVSRTISVSFKEPMDLRSLNTSTFILNDQYQNSVSGTVSYYHSSWNNFDYTATFTPDGPLSYSTTYMATVTTGAIDLYGGNSLLSDYSWSFTTETNPDVTPPTILNTNPAQNSYCAGVNSPITVKFNEGIDATTLNSNSFYLQDDLRNLVDTNISYEESRASLLPVTSLNYNSAYTATMTQAIADYAGNTLISDYFLDFTTVINEGAGNWVRTTLDNAPPSLNGLLAIWTGDRMIVWGYTILGNSNNVYAYNPVTDSWTELSPDNTIYRRVRRDASVVWTGSEMIVWGGFASGSLSTTGTGAAYNPSTDTWRTISYEGAPTARRFHNAVWTGTEMIIWGGSNASRAYSDGARYNPVTDSWTPMSNVNSPVNNDVYENWSSLVWTGTEAILWSSYRPEQSARYNPATDTWSSVSTTNAPDYAFSDYVAVWSGTEMLLFGRSSSNGQNGGRYNPITDSWSSMSELCGYEPRSDLEAIWTDNNLIIWDGIVNGAIYTPVTDSWQMMNITNAPSQRTEQTMIWTGSEVIVWGGLNSNNNWLNTGGRYFP